MERDIVCNPVARPVVRNHEQPVWEEIPVNGFIEFVWLTGMDYSNQINQTNTQTAKSEATVPSYRVTCFNSSLPFYGISTKLTGRTALMRLGKVFKSHQPATVRITIQSETARLMSRLSSSCIRC